MRRISINGISALSALAAAVGGGVGNGGSAWAGPYAPAAGVAGSTAISNASPAIVAWATGFENYTFGPNVDLQFRDATKALGAAQGNSFEIVSLGDGGAITLTFASAIADGAGFDFAIFENSFNDTFLELAFVEVSADNGQTFHRFANDSLTANPVPFIGGSVDPTNIDGLAGKYRQGFGTPFDLGALGLAQATHVRVADVVGDGTALDTSGNAIYDPHPTVGSGGFDLDGVGVVHQVPEPTGAAVAIAAVGAAMLLRRSRRMGSLLAIAMLAIASTRALADTVVDFEDLSLAPNTFYNGNDGAGQVVSHGVSFGNVYDNTFQSWHGFAASSVNDTTTPGYGNQYAAISGAGAGGGGNYGIGYDPTGGGYGSPPTVTLASESQLSGLFVTNSTYAYLAVRDGDDGNTTPFVRQFGDDPDLSGTGNQGEEDYFKLTITGRNAADQATGSVDFYLADYRFADNASDYVVDSWQWVDLSPLGSAVKSLEFVATSTDASFGFINTPAFFAIDDLTIVDVPEPATPLAGMLAVLSLMSRRRCARH